MKKRRILVKKYLLLFILPILLIGCYKDIDQSEPEQEIIEITEVYINTKISGHVVDITNNKLQDYQLMINDELFDIEGNSFIIESKRCKQRGQTIYVIKDGRTIGLATVLLVENDINHIVMHSFSEWKTKKETIDNKSILIDDISVEIKSSSFLSNNAVYKGDLNIKYGIIEQQNKITTIGYSEELDVLIVNPIGGFFISFQDDNGDILSIDDKNALNLKLDNIPSNTDALLYFNEEKEHWIKIVDIKEQNNIRIIKSGYFIFAKYDTGVFVSGDVNHEGNPISYQPIVWNNGLLSGNYSSTMSGNWIAVLPENELINIQLFNQCGEALQQESIQTKATNIIDRKIIIEDITNYTSLDFTVIDCNGEAISNPAIVINEDVEYNFEGDNVKALISSSCEALTIAAKSGQNNEIGPAVLWNEDTANAINYLSNCESLTDGFTYIKIADDKKIYDSFTLNTEFNKTILTSISEEVQITIEGVNEGSYTEDQVNIKINDSEFGNNAYYIDCSESKLGCGITSCIITQLDNQGWTTIRLSGKIWIQNLDSNEANTLDIEAEILIKE